MPKAQGGKKPFPKLKYIKVPQPWLETCDMLRNYVPFVTEGLGVLPILAVEDAPHPAWTDGKSITLCPSKWEEIRNNTIEQGKAWFPSEACGRAVLILHELIHIISKHPDRIGHRIEKKWITACDIVDNEMVVDILKLPPFHFKGDKLDKLEAAIAASGTYDKQYHGLAAEEVYALLPDDPEGPGKNPNQPPQQGQGKGQGEGGQSGEKPQEQPQQPPQEGEGEGAGEGQGEGQEGSGDQPGEGNGDGEGEGSGGEGEGGGDDVSDMFGEDFGGGVPKSDVPEDMGELVENALKDYMERHGKKLHSRNGSAMSREMDEAAKKPVISLSEVLRKIRDTVPQKEYSYRNIGRNDMWMARMGMSLRMPSATPSKSDILRELVICIDASGSMSPEELKAANRIVLDAFKHVKGHKIRRIVFTSKIEEDVIVTEQEIPPIVWTGGTRIDSIIDEFEKEKIKPSAVILITDAEDSEECKKRFESWKHLSKLRTIITKGYGGKHASFPGITFNVDKIE